MEMKYKNVTFIYEDIINEKTFTIPDFQRGIAWKKNKKQNFIETLINGEPFGTILIYRDKNTYLIDGLQRINTIREFNNNNYMYLKESIIDDDDCKKFISLIKKVYKLYSKKIDKIKIVIGDDKKVKKAIIDKIIKNNGDIESVYYSLKKRFNMTSFQDKECKDIKELIKEIIKKINKMCNIKSLKVYALEYTGNVEKLPDIFYNLNTGGVTLSKYDILPSLWNDIKYHIKDKEIIDLVYERYNSLKNSSQFNIVISKKTLKTEGIDLFQYCYALGKLLYKPENGYTSFIGKGSDNVEPIIFSILALLLGLNENQTSDIGKKLKKATPEFLNDLKNVIIDGFNTLKKGLYDYVKSEKVSDNKNETFNYVPSNYMIYHMFMAYVKKNYVIDIKNNEIIKNNQGGIDSWNKKFIENLHLHYFYDFIRNYWSDHRQVSDLMDDIKNENTLYRYSYVIGDDEWRDAFEKLKREQLNYESKSFNLKTKMFLDYLIKFKIKDNPKLREFFRMHNTKEPFSIDYEHIVSLNDFKERNITDVPMYSLGNACFLTSRVNRSIQGETLYEQAKKNPGYKVDTVFTDFVNYPSEEELSFISDNRDEFIKKYMEFIEKRIDKLIKDFLEYKV